MSTLRILLYGQQKIPKQPMKLTPFALTSLERSMHVWPWGCWAHFVSKSQQLHWHPANSSGTFWRGNFINIVAEWQSNMAYSTGDLFLYLEVMVLGRNHGFHVHRIWQADFCSMGHFKDNGYHIELTKSWSVGYVACSARFQNLMLHDAVNILFWNKILIWKIRHNAHKSFAETALVLREVTSATLGLVERNHCK
jgi:hypothetical protein